MNRPKPYEYADAIVKSLNRIGLHRFEAVKSKLIIDGFDELNVIKQVKALYASLNNDNKKAYKQLFVDCYIAILLWLSKREKIKKREEDQIYEMAEMHMLNLLKNPNPVTRYAYDTEVLRKRDRAIEAINSVAGSVKKQQAMDGALRQWSSMTWWYADFMEEEATLAAMEDFGVERVQRHELEDTRTCQECEDADGAVYDIDKIPPAPHPNCRRWFSVYRH